MASPTGPAQPSDKALLAKQTAQIKRLTDANAKYKHLLKLAKERIQNQEENLTNLKETASERKIQDEKDAGNAIGLEDANNNNGEFGEEISIVRVIQRVQVHQSSSSNPGSHPEIWALMEMESVDTSAPVDPISGAGPTKKFKQWKRFELESELSDFIRRDTGEPLKLPPYSLSPDQSAKIVQETTEQVSKLTEEFRRFRVRSELARKQADAQIRELQNMNVRSATQRIETSSTEGGHRHGAIGTDLAGNNLSSSKGGSSDVEASRSSAAVISQLRVEMLAQENHWKEAYDVLMAENSMLKSAGSDAMLAAQWRQRYETCMQEKEDMASKLKMKASKSEDVEAEKYERKYRDLKESFRLYRKKAKEIFEAQQRGDSPAALLTIGDSSSAEAKLSYIKNLMVNYLSSDTEVQDHMETAIGTVLKFTADDMSKIKKKKASSEAWF